jgi:hypothetical protein
VANQPNLDTAQANWAGIRTGDYAIGFDNTADEVIVENGPRAGTWHRARNNDDLALVYLEFA